MARFQSIHLAPSIELGAPLGFQTDHLQVSLSSGRVSLVKGQEGTLGLFFQGEGSFTYTSRDPYEFPAMAYNLQANTKVALREGENSRFIKEPLREGLFWFSGRAVPVPVGMPGPDLAGAFHSFRRDMARSWSAPLEHTLLLHAANAPGIPMVLAEMKGAQAWVYQLDPVGTQKESLSLLYERLDFPRDLEKPLLLAPISQQPLGWTWKSGHPPPFQTIHLKVDVQASAGNDVIVDATETLVPTRDGQRAFAFNLSTETWTPSGVNLVRRHHRLVSLTDGQGRPIPFDHQRGRLVVVLPEAPPKGAPFILRFRVEGDFLIREGGDNAWQLGVNPWYPQGDHGGLAFRAEARVRVPKPFVPIMGGTVVSRREEGKDQILETRFDQPVPFLVIQAGDFRLTEGKRNGVTVRLWNYAKANSQEQRVIGLAHDIIGFYEKLIGPFPFPELDIIEQNDWGFGQAPAGVVFITREAFNQIHSLANRYFSKGINARFAHEIAHQYWGNQVRWTGQEDQWLSESFAEISGALFVRWAYGPDGNARYKEMENLWRTHAEEVAQRCSIPFANRARHATDPLQAVKTRTYLLYDKGALLLSRIHQEIGDQGFATFLKAFHHNFKWKAGGTQHVPGLLKVLTKKDWDPFFESNFWGTGLP
ncbi:MAG: hypothetical protein HY823_02850 [Acidobacteria bacterium]|nr:hypothetical protein [Acidobacteriota bacterium]